MDMKKTITVETVVNASVEKVWTCWTVPAHVTRWNNASDDWHTPHGENDLRTGGTFLYRMEAKDGSAGFDFAGVYDKVENHRLISYTLDDNRKVTIAFTKQGDGKTIVVETFEAEGMHSLEMQRSGWQAILD